MQAIETTGTINALGQLSLDQPVAVDRPTRVRVIVLLTEASNQTSEQAERNLACHQTVPETDQSPDIRPIWERVVDISAQVPPEEWAKVPKDLSKNVDHYLYGSPKEDE
jgi:hypothetical protein